MPTRNYMVVDARRDHSIRIPRPELTEQFGVPNACASCHKDKSAECVAEKFAKWYGRKGVDTIHYARARDRPGDGPLVDAAISRGGI
jgi:hypothetical protein